MPAYEMRSLHSYDDGGIFGCKAFRCGLARPAAELTALACLVKHGNVLRAWVKDAVLYVEDDETGGERLARWHVELARSVLAEALAKAPDLLAEGDLLRIPTVAETWDEPLRRDYNGYCYSRKPLAVGYRGLDYVLPSGGADMAALVAEVAPGRYGVHLLHRTSHPKDYGGKLATALFSLLAGRDVVRSTERDARGFEGPDDFTLSSAGLPRGEACAIGTVAMRLAERAIPAYEKAMEDLPVEGKPSHFTDEDNDARDVLLEFLAGGAEIRVLREGADGDRRFFLDEVEVPDYLYGRLSEMLEGDGDWRTRTPDTAYRLSDRVKLRPRDLRPRDHAVSFLSFSEKCRYRRYDSGRDCANPDKGNQDDCNLCCPLVSPVYRKEVGHMHEDAFFGWVDERDVEVTADHPGTERSYAWKASNGLRVEAIVNTVAHAYGAYQALKAHGTEKDTLLVTIDGGCTGVKEVGEGIFGATSQQYPSKMAELGMAAIVTLAKTGKKPATSAGLDFFNTGSQLVTDKAVSGLKSISSTEGAKICWGK